MQTLSWFFPIMRCTSLLTHEVFYNIIYSSEEDSFILEKIFYKLWNCFKLVLSFAYYKLIFIHSMDFTMLILNINHKN